MIICPHCNLMDLPDNTEICPKCHQRIIIARCKDCNRQLFGSETKRCPECKKAYHEKIKKLLIIGGVVIFVAAGGYTISPIDIVPDVMGPLGIIDDVAVLLTGSTLGLTAIVSGFVNGAKARNVEDTQSKAGNKPNEDIFNKPEPEIVDVPNETTNNEQ